MLTPRAKEIDAEGKIRSEVSRHAKSPAGRRRVHVFGFPFGVHIGRVSMPERRAAPVLHRGSGPASGPPVTVRRSRSESVRLIHRGEKPIGLPEVFRLGHES